MDEAKLDAAMDALFDGIDAEDQAWIAIGSDLIVFRFGPFKKDEVGALAEQAVDHGVDITIIYQSGREINWTAMREVSPVEYRSLKETE